MFRMAMVAAAVVLGLVWPVKCEGSGVPEHNYGWTLSDSSTDPFSVEGAASADTLTLYLWLYCAKPGTGGVATAKFGFYTSGALQYAQFTPEPGVVNSATGSTVFDLALPGCPTGAFLVGELRLSVVEDVYFVCLEPHEPVGDFVTVGCTLTDPEGNAFLGYNAGGPKGCSNDPDFFFGGIFGEPCEPTTSVSSSTWGTVKASYYTVP